MGIKPGDFENESVRELLRLHLQGMRANSPACSVHALDLSGLQQPNVSFWTVWSQDALAGCGALKELDPTHGEVKSMRTDPLHLGNGVGAAILQHILNVARARGYERVSLETGTGEAFDAAHALYRRFGFLPCGPFNTYTDDPFSAFYTIDVGAVSPAPASLRSSRAELIDVSDVRHERLANALTEISVDALCTALEDDPALATARFGSQEQSRTSLHMLTDYPARLPACAAKVRLLWAHGADPNAAFIGSHRETPLHWAASADDVEALNELLDLGADVNAGGGVLTGGGALDDAVIFAQMESARILVHRGAMVELFHAAALGMDHHVQHLIATADSQHRQAALWHAARNGHQTSVDLLIGAGADPSSVGFEQLTPVQVAKRHGHALNFA